MERHAALWHRLNWSDRDRQTPAGQSLDDNKTFIAYHLLFCGHRRDGAEPRALCSPIVSVWHFVSSPGLGLCGCCERLGPYTTRCRVGGVPVTSSLKSPVNLASGRRPRPADLPSWHRGWGVPDRGAAGKVLNGNGLQRPTPAVSSGIRNARI